MTKINRYYIIILAVLILTAIILYITDYQGTLDINYNGFAVKDTGKVDNITIKGKRSAIILEKREGRWIINKKYIANSHVINKFLSGLHNLEITAPVPRKIKDEIINRMNDISLIVQISSGEKYIKKFKISENPLTGGGLMAMFEGAKEPYIIQISGNESNLFNLFTTNTYVWRERLVFTFQIQDILSVQVTYPQNKESSFILNISDNKGVTIKSAYYNKVSGITTEKAIQYLTSFQSVHFHWIFPDVAKSVNDSLTRVAPFCKIQIQTIDNKVNNVNLYHIPTGEKKVGFNLDKIYVQFQGDSIPVIVKYIDIDSIIKEYHDF